MWSRAELKKKGKAAFKRNYWVCVLVALIIVLISGDTDFQFYRDFFDDKNDTIYDSQIDDIPYDEEDDDFYENVVSDEDEQESVVERVTNVIVGNNKKGNFILHLLLPEPFTGMFAITSIVFFIVFAFLLALSIFIINVLLVGCNRFFVQNAERPAKARELLYGFNGNHYKNIVKIQFFKDLYTFLWTLLLIIPGIIKSYEYYMISYLVADNPEMSMDEAFARSKEMMYGNKWDTFVLELSFILWHFLSAVTFGIVGVFYVQPYKEATKAELYHVLKEKQ